MAKNIERIGVEVLPLEMNVVLVDKTGLVKKAWNRRIQEGNPLDRLMEVLQELFGKKWNRFPIHLSLPLGSLSQTGLKFSSSVQNPQFCVDWYLDKYLGSTSKERTISYQIDPIDDKSSFVHISALNSKELKEIAYKCETLNFKPASLIPEPVALLNLMEHHKISHAKGLVFKLNQENGFWLTFEGNKLLQKGSFDAEQSGFPHSYIEEIKKVIERTKINVAENSLLFVGSRLKDDTLQEMIKSQFTHAIFLDLITGNSKVELTKDVTMGCSNAYGLTLGEAL